MLKTNRDNIEPYSDAEADSELRSKNVLVVEDDEHARLLLERLLQRVDPAVHIDWATTGNEALVRLEEVQYDLMVTDIVLPNLMNRVDLWKCIRSRHPRMNVALTSAIGVGQFLEMMRDIPECPQFIPKPFRIEECLIVLSQLLDTSAKPYIHPSFRQ